MKMGQRGIGPHLQRYPVFVDSIGLPSGDLSVGNPQVEVRLPEIRVVSQRSLSCRDRLLILRDRIMLAAGNRHQSEPEVEVSRIEVGVVPQGRLIFGYRIV